MTYATLLARNLRRNRLRTALTTLSILLAVFLVCAVLTLPSGLAAIVDRMASATRLSVHNKAGIAYLLPYSYLHKIRAVPGVAAATSFMWFGGIYDEPKNMFPNFAVDPDAVGAVWPDYGIDPQTLADFQRHRDAALVGHRTMRTFGWKVGDRVTLRGTAWPVDLDFRIVGELTKNPVWFLFSRVYLEEALRAKGQSADFSGMMWVRVAAADEVEPVMRRIDDLFRNSTAETASETEKSFYQSFMSSLSGLTRIIVMVGFLAVAAVVFIAANSSSMTIRERAAEIAILKALGFRRHTLLALLLGETLLLAAGGGIVGACGAYGLLKLLAYLGATSARPGLGPLSMFEMTGTILLEGIALSLVIGIVAGVIPAWGAARKPVAAAVREVF
ncbi:MAG TPA: ABC transporter permease [Candidatus Binatia bacterium]|nr:ABC transporter permease [Candidatus Binatia bacterium]